MRLFDHLFRLILLSATLNAVIAQASELYLYIPGISGESNTPGFSGDIKLASFSGVVANSFSVEKLIDKASPALFSATNNATSFPFVNVLVYNVRGAEPQPDIVYRFSGAMLSTINSVSIASLPGERDTFIFSSVAVVPEPATWFMLAMGIVLIITLLAMRRVLWTLTRH